MYGINDRCFVLRQSLSPGLEDLGDSGIVPETAVDLGFSQDVLVSGAGISVPQSGQLVLSEGNQLVLLLLADSTELFHGLVDGFDHKWKDGVLGVVHFSLGNAF